MGLVQTARAAEEDRGRNRQMAMIPAHHFSILAAVSTP